VRKAAGSDDAQRLAATAWRIAVGRAPSDKELRTSLEFLHRNGLARLCLLIFNLNEFVYVD
jgi:hypothetical protein